MQGRVKIKIIATFDEGIKLGRSNDFTSSWPCKKEVTTTPFNPEFPRRSEIKARRKRKVSLI
jgi:hypothetical protein